MANSVNDLVVFFFTSIAMFILPIVTYFGVKNFLEEEFHVKNFNSTIGAVVCAVIVVNMIILLYATIAYKQELKEEGERSYSLQSPDEKTTPPLNKSDLILKKVD